MSILQINTRDGLRGAHSSSDFPRYSRFRDKATGLVKHDPLRFIASCSGCVSGPHIWRDVVRFAEEPPLDRITGQADRTSIHCQSKSVIFHSWIPSAIVQDIFFMLTFYAS
jgi:hypothetical protein